MQLYLIWQISKFMGKGIVITDILQIEEIQYLIA